MTADTRHLWALGAIGVIFTIASATYFGHAASSDLMAVYLAAREFSAGHLDRIYADARPLFDLSVPQGWPALAARIGAPDMQLYPYVYPPLWAAVFSPVSNLLSPQAVFKAATILNPVLLVASAFLGWRILRPAISPTRWVVTGLAIVIVTPIGHIALYQNQPQILVSFLILLAIERRRARAPVSAGIALALAASIKLYPVLFAIVWIARRDWKPLAAFAITGLLLGIASIAVGGWALTAEFLQQIRVIARTVLVTQLSFNLDSLLGQFFAHDLLRPVQASGANVSGYLGPIAEKPLVQILLTRAVLLTGLITAFRLARNADTDRLYSSVWPALLIFVSLTSPLSWAYHYLSAAFLFPALLQRDTAGGMRVTALICLVLLSLPAILFLSGITLIAPPDGQVGFFLGQAVGTVAITVLMLLYLLRPLHRGISETKN